MPKYSKDGVHNSFNFLGNSAIMNYNKKINLYITCFDCA